MSKRIAGKIVSKQILFLEYIVCPFLKKIALKAEFYFRTKTNPFDIIEGKLFP